MANYCGSGRTNYFRVKDEQKFRDFIFRFSGDMELAKQGDLYAILLTNDSGDFPDAGYSLDTDDYEDVDFIKELREHIADDEIA